MKHFWQLLILVLLIACQPVTAIPTQTGTSTPTIIPSLETPVRYELRQPQPSDLLKMIDSVLLMEEKMTYHEDVTTSILGREPGVLQYLIAEDFERYYLDGFPGAEVFVISYTFPWEMKSFGDLSSFSIVLRIALLQYINNHQDVLEDKTTFQLPNANIKTISMDLDGDGNLEWLVDATYEQLSLQDWFIINQQKDGRYHLLPSEINYDQIPIMDRDTEIAIIDLTGEGNPEIIKVEYYYFAGSGSGIIKVYTWKAGKLSLYTSIRLPSVPPVYGELHTSDYIIGDFDGDGVDDLRVDQPRFGRFGCQWTQSSIYYLDGRSLDVEVEGEEIPQTNDCLIARALESENAAEQLQLYQEALRKFDPEVSPLDKFAWIKLHLAMSYTANGDDVRANLQLQDLINMEGEGKFLKFIKDKYVETNSPSPLVFCDALHSSIASQDIPGSIGSEIDIDLTHGAYPIDFAPVANLICPFPQVLGRRLDNLEIPVSESSIIDILTSKGYSFIWSQSMNWDSDSQQEWLGVLDFRQPMLALMDSDKNWNIKAVETYSPGLSKVDSTVYIPEDGSGLKILILFSSKGKYCDSPNTDKWLLVVNPETVEHEGLYLCDTNTYSLASKDNVQLALQEFSKSQRYESFEAPDWYYLPEINEITLEQKSILEAVSELGYNVLNQINSGKTASKISALMESLPKDDPAARLLLNRLYYLRGLNYELSGRNELAVAAYLELIEFSPESLWSKLAEIRIQISQP